MMAVDRKNSRSGEKDRTKGSSFAGANKENPKLTKQVRWSMQSVPLSVGAPPVFLGVPSKCGLQNHVDYCTHSKGLHVCTHERLK